MNKMLSTDCLGTQEFHTFHKTTEILEDSQSQEIAFHEAALGSTLVGHQNVHSIAAVSAGDIGMAEVSLLHGESDTSATGLLPVSFLSCGPRSMVPISVPSSSGLETILTPNPMYSDIQLKDVNYNATAMEESTEFLQLILSGNDEGYNTSSELQVWDVLDFYFSESFSDVQFDSIMGFTSDVSTSSHDYMNIADLVERPVALLSLNETEEPNNAANKALVDHSRMDPDDTSLYLQMKPPDSEIESTSASQDVIGIEYVDSIPRGLPSNEKLHSRGLPDLMDVDSSNRLRKSPVRTKHVTLVLDLDETLVHSTLDHCDISDFSIQVFFNMKDHTVHVRQRPYLKMFLEKVAQMFELVIFTASQRIYAEQIIDRLDPDGKLISQRIYRESCIFSDGSYTKDLTILGVHLAKVAIIDNTPQVFQLQVDNGIPIKSWFDDPADQELVELLPFLETLVDAEDVRPLISKTFHGKVQQD
ncbi:probable phosphatase PSR2 isoform X2 [Triticum urartu]|uniref:FCP1 homology domain-containing protein n=2 Tax=Triticum urartu TaxID=4572 RepID=A0A8R7TV34_TRIUA|nr:probable phosphatase PSR2 isoform X2 [Triticum urartu]